MTTIQKTKKIIYKPFIKWVGGKRQLLPQLEKFYPKYFNRYFEPFVGGGAMFFDLRNKFGTTFTAYLFDINEDMIITYNTIKNNVKELIDELKTYPYDKEFFIKIRALDRETNFKNISNIKRSARFIYLNRTGFNGLHRVNSSGFFNVPFGKYKNPTICDEENLIASKEALKNTTIKNSDFESILKYAEKGDFVYFDPPYDILTDTANFTNYNKGGFGKKEQIRLFETFKKLDKKGCFLMLSNHNTPFINELYKDYRKELVLARRAINSDASKRGLIEETVILNY
ncbi:MAG: DNA adenine methylase [Candidatus Absconditabacterales bacterium]|nr:DNA adenine methylase [Candidatus Absconditabacterales bacterium]